MKHSRIKLSKRHVLFYLSWAIAFAIIPIVVARPEKLTFGMIFFAVIISALVSIPATSFFFKSVKRKTRKSEDIHFDLLPEEKVIQKANANLRKGVILLGGVLLLTDKHILFIGSEFFNKNKRLIYLPLNSITEVEHDDKNLMIKEDSGKKHTFLLDRSYEFHAKIRNAL
jgi:hypothetical protein